MSETICESLSGHLKLNFFVGVDTRGMDFIVVGTMKDDFVASQGVCCGSNPP